jgi:hypothetical protein
MTSAATLQKGLRRQATYEPATPRVSLSPDSSYRQELVAPGVGRFFLHSCFRKIRINL